MLSGKTVIVTGASSGLGACLAVELANVGASLALFARDEQRLESVAKRCRDIGAQTIVVAGDVTWIDDCRRLVAATVAELGGIDVVIANAGVSMWSRFDQIEDVEVFRRLIEVNYLGAVNCIHSALEQLVARRGMIVAISSIQGRIPVPLHTGYVASKHALVGFCDTLRMELADSGVDIMTVMPHWLRGTELRQHALGSDGRALGGESRSHSSESITLEKLSAAILDGIENRRRELMVPWKLRLLVALHALRPQWAEALVTRAVTKQDRRR